MTPGTGAVLAFPSDSPSGLSQNAPSGAPTDFSVGSRMLRLQNEFFPGWTRCNVIIISA